MGNIKETNLNQNQRKPVNENAALYDLGDIKETNLSSSRNENAALYDLGDIKETGFHDRNNSMTSNDFGFGDEEEVQAMPRRGNTPKERGQSAKPKTITEDEEEVGEDTPLHGFQFTNGGVTSRTVSLLAEVEFDEHGDIYDNTGITDL